MQKIKLYLLLFLAVAMISGCSEYDDSGLKNDLNDLRSRVEKLETWCSNANSQINALQGLVTALEQNDFVTGITPLIEDNKTVGYTITFSKNSPITIRNGKDGVDGISPVIGAALDTDGIYYWTIRIGDSQADWLLDAEGKKIPTTGASGITPQLSIDEEDGILYWKVNGEWLLSNGRKVPATGAKGDNGAKGDTGSQGDKGDAVFAEGGIDDTHPDYVVFTLVNGNQITLPRISELSIGFDSYDALTVNTDFYEITLTLPASMKATDYAAIKAEVTNSRGSGTDIKTRAAATVDVWGTEVTQPTFLDDGTLATPAKVTVTPPAIIENGEDKALLEVTIIDKNGKKNSSTRVIIAKPSVGAYYMNDGSTIRGNISLTREQQDDCIGIVYWLGDPTQLDATLRTDHPECTHGLVVALTGEEQMKWMEQSVSAQNWLNVNANSFLSVLTKVGNTELLNNIMGYNNTKALTAYNASADNANSLITAVQKVMAYRTAVPAPSKSSNWYLPAAKELSLLCGDDITNIGSQKFGTANRDFINDRLSSISDAATLSLSPYWSFCEASATRAFYVDFSNSEFGSGSAGTNTKDRNYKVRFVLAF